MRASRWAPSYRIETPSNRISRCRESGAGRVVAGGLGGEQQQVAVDQVDAGADELQGVQRGHDLGRRRLQADRDIPEQTEYGQRLESPIVHERVDTEEREDEQHESGLDRNSGDLAQRRA